MYLLTGVSVFLAWAGCDAPTGVDEGAGPAILRLHSHSSGDAQGLPSCGISGWGAFGKGDIRLVSGSEEIDGVTYLRTKVLKEDLTAPSEPPELVLKVCVGPLERGASVTDCRVHSRVPFRIVVEDGNDILLQDAASGGVLPPPYLFCPGTYHFQARKQ